MLQARLNDLIAPLEVLRRYPPHQGTMLSMLQSRASVQPHKDYLVFEGASYTYAQALDCVRRVAAVLVAQGVQAGDRVGVMSSNHPSSVFLILALGQVGAIYVPVNPDYGVAEAQYVLEHAQVCGVVCAPGALRTVQAACAALQPAPWLLLNEEASDNGTPRVLSALMATATPLQTDAGTPTGTCLFIYTSGTTGFPKGVMHCQRSLHTAGEGFVARMYLQPDDRVLCVLPMFHINAIFYSMAGSLAAGALA